MFQFLLPIGLLAITGISLPVIIHLWNKREGKTLKIGSVQLLAETARQQARSLRLKDLLLLLLRCIIIMLLAEVLAKPVWLKQLTTKDRKGWLLLDMETKATYKQYKPLIDSLLLAGFEAHRFSSGFPLLNFKDSLPQNSPADTLPYWVLLKALNEQVPTNLPVYLVTTNRLSRFSGSRPAVAINLHWFTYATADTATNNPVASRLLSSDSVETITAHSTPGYTSYLFDRTAKGQPTKTSQYDGNGSTDATSVTTDTSTLRIAILKDLTGSDAAYLEAALNAIRQFGQYRIQIELLTDPTQLTATYDWVFWLSQKVPPASVKIRHLFVYEQAREKSVSSWLNTTGVDGSGGNEIRLMKGVEKKEQAAGETIWANGYGEPVLTLEKGKYNVLHFYSRFNPAWSDLVWSNAFPQMLYEVMLQSNIKSPHDNRLLDTYQLLPEIVFSGNAATKPAFTQTTDLSKWIWATAFLLFALERIISLTAKKEMNA